MDNTTPAPIVADAWPTDTRSLLPLAARLLKQYARFMESDNRPLTANEARELADALASAAQPEREPHPPHRDCGCAECAPSFETDEPTLTVTMRYDLSPDAIEGAIRNRLIEMGWTPPDAAAPKAAPAPTTQAAPAAVAGSSQETCQTCQGNGEVVTDWERYKHPFPGDVGDEAVAECQDCDGQGTVGAAPTTQAAPETREALGRRLISEMLEADSIATAACRQVAELPDRSSPEDWPEAMLVTQEELHSIVFDAVNATQAAIRQQELLAKIQRLQRALAFWLPQVPSEDHTLQDRIAHDAFLLAGYSGPNEPAANELGHVALTTAPAPSAQGDARLWCVHVQGPDDVHAMPSRAAALERANELNECFGRHRHEAGDPIMRAVVIEWPHAADLHVTALYKRAAADAARVAKAGGA